MPVIDDVDLLKMQKILGHHSILTAARYLHLTSHTAAYCCKVADFMEILFTRLFQVAYGSHRW